MLAVKWTIGLLFLASLALLATPYPYLSALPVVAVAGVMALNRWPGLGIAALAALVPLEGLFANNKLFTGAKLLGIGLLLVALLHMVLRRKNERDLFGNLWRPLMFFVMCYVLSFAFSIHLGASVEHARQMLVGLLLFVLVLVFWRDLNVDLTIRAVVLGVSASCMVTLAMASRQAKGRAIGLMDDPNYFALLVAFALPLSVLLMLRAKTWLLRGFWLATTGLLLTGMIKSDSRSGFVVMMLVIAAMMWNYRSALRVVRPSHFGWLVLAVGLGIAAAATVLPKAYIERIQSLVLIKSGVKSYQDTSLGRRMSYLLVGGAAIAEDPILGSGPGTYPILYGHTGYAAAFSNNVNAPDFFRRAHNTYLELLSETGLAGGLCFLWLVIAGLNNFWQARAQAIRVGDSVGGDWATHLGLAFLALALFMLFLSIPNHKYLWMMLAVSTAIRYRLDEVRRTGAEAPGVRA